MIELYSWPTPNGIKIAIALEELELPYEYKPIDISKGDQFNPEYLKISPNNKIPCIVDRNPPSEYGPEPLAVFESAAILTYLAENKGPAAGGNSLTLANPRGKLEIQEWLDFQIASVGPMFGQLGHFFIYAPEKVPYAIDRYTKEANRLLGVVERRLGGTPPNADPNAESVSTPVNYLCGNEFTIADLANWCWLKDLTRFGITNLQQTYPNVKAWVDRIGERPGVKRGLAALQPKSA